MRSSDLGNLPLRNLKERDGGFLFSSARLRGTLVCNYYMKIDVIFRCAIVRSHPLIMMVVLQGVGSQSFWNFGVRTGLSRRP